MRAVVVLVLLCAVAQASLVDKIMDAKAAAVEAKPAETEWVYAEIVGGEEEPVLSEVESTTTQTPGYYQSAGYYGYQPTYAHPYVAPQAMHFAQVQQAAPAVQPYAQWGYPYSAYPPIPPAMPTYLPPPPYIPIPQGGGESE